MKEKSECLEGADADVAPATKTYLFWEKWSIITIASSENKSKMPKGFKSREFEMQRNGERLADSATRYISFTPNIYDWYLRWHYVILCEINIFM